jgi:transposase-like protein
MATPARVPSPEEGASPVAEAKSLLALVAAREETPLSIRASLAPGLSADAASAGLRRATLLHFDAMLLRVNLPALRAGRVQLMARANGKLRPSPTLEATILSHLRTRPISTVARSLHVPASVVKQISSVHKVAFHKIGRGRHFDEAQRQELVAALKSGVTQAALKRRDRVSGETLRKLRRTYLNDDADLRYRRRWCLETVTAALAAKKRPSLIEQETGIDHRQLWKLRRTMGDMRDLRHENRRVLSAAERSAMETDIRAGLNQRVIAKKFHTHYLLVRSVQVSIGLPPRACRKLTRAEGAKLNALILKGRKTNKELAGEFGCNPKSVWRRRKQLRGAL